MKRICCYFSICLTAGLIACQPKTENKNIVSHDSDASHSVPSPVKATPNPYTAVDVSPMDMAYFPDDYPIVKMGNPQTPPPKARVIYSRPHLQGRKLFVNLQQYGQPWRLGANESTELDLYQDSYIQDKKVSAGRYVLYCIPQPGEWTIVLNSNIDSWGLKPDSTRDVIKFSIPETAHNRPVEYFTMIFQKTDAGAELIMAWDDREARLPFRF
jgi:hypothetical protein